MRTVSSTPIITEGAAVNGRRLDICVHREPHRRLSWIAGVSFTSDWKGEGPLAWEGSTADAAALVTVLRSFDLRTRIAGVHAGEGQAPPAMEARREQLRLVWEGLVGRIARGVASDAGNAQG